MMFKWLKEWLEKRKRRDELYWQYMRGEKQLPTSLPYIFNEYSMGQLQDKMKDQYRHQL